MMCEQSNWGIEWHNAQPSASQLLDEEIRDDFCILSCSGSPIYDVEVNVNPNAVLESRHCDYSTPLHPRIQLQEFPLDMIRHKGNASESYLGQRLDQGGRNAIEGRHKYRL
jgi:hypothetical protein